MKKCKILDSSVVVIDDYLIAIQRIYYRKEKHTNEYHAFSEIVWPTGVATSDFNKLMKSLGKKGTLIAFCECMTFLFVINKIKFIFLIVFCSRKRISFEYNFFLGFFRRRIHSCYQCCQNGTQ